jgi:HSP20 family protein
VDVQDGVLTIKAKVNEKKASETENMIRKERRSGFFSRSINVGKTSMLMTSKRNSSMGY